MFMKEKIKRHRKLAVGLIVLLAAVLIVTAAVKMLSGPEEEPSHGQEGVQAFRLKPQNLSSSIHTSGKVESAGVVEITTDMTGQITELPVSLGDHVQQGDVLCVFDGQEIRQQIADLEKQDAQARKEVDQQRKRLQQDLDAAKAQQQAAALLQASAQELYQKVVNGEIEGDAETVLGQLSEAQSASAEAASMVSAAQAALGSVDESAITQNSDQLQKLRQQLNQLTVTAPQSGIITALNVSRGSIPNGSLMRIEDDGNLKVTVNIREQDILKLSEGMNARITCDAVDSERVFSGQVIRVINFASAGSGSDAGGESGSGGGYSATVSLEPGTPLLLGMSVKVEILLDDTGEQLAVPYDSLVADDGGRDYIYRAVEQEDGTYLIEQVMVTVGQAGEYYTAVSAEDLKEGDIIINDPYEVTEGQKVELYLPEEEDLYPDQE